MLLITFKLSKLNKWAIRVFTDRVWRPRPTDLWTRAQRWAFASPEHNWVWKGDRSDVDVDPRGSGDRSVENSWRWLGSQQDHRSRSSRYHRGTDDLATNSYRRSSRLTWDRKSGGCSCHRMITRWSGLPWSSSSARDWWWSSQSIAGSRRTALLYPRIFWSTQSVGGLEVWRCPGNGADHAIHRRASYSTEWSTACLVDRSHLDGLSYPVSRTICTCCHHRWWISNGILHWLPYRVDSSFRIFGFLRPSIYRKVADLRRHRSRWNCRGPRRFYFPAMSLRQVLIRIRPL